LGQDLRRTNNGIIDLVFFDASLLGIGIALILHNLIDLRCQGGGIPHHQFCLARRMGSAHQPPGCSRRQDGSRSPSLLQDVASCQHDVPPSLAHPRALTSLLLTTEEQKHDHQRQMTDGYGHGIVVTTSPTPPDTVHRSPLPPCAPPPPPSPPPSFP